MQTGNATSNTEITCGHYRRSSNTNGSMATRDTNLLLFFRAKDVSWVLKNEGIDLLSQLVWDRAKVSVRTQDRVDWVGTARMPFVPAA